MNNHLALGPSLQMTNQPSLDQLMTGLALTSQNDQAIQEERNETFLSNQKLLEELQQLMQTLSERNLQLKKEKADLEAKRVQNLQANQAQINTIRQSYHTYINQSKTTLAKLQNLQVRREKTRHTVFGLYDAYYKKTRPLVLVEFDRELNEKIDVCKASIDGQKYMDFIYEDRNLEQAEGLKGHIQWDAQRPGETWGRVKKI